MRSGYYAMLSLRDQGVIKAFGAGVNEWEVCQTLAERGDFDLFLLAGRYTLLEQEALRSFLPLCEKRGIGVVLGGPYNSGILATGPKPGAFYNYFEAPAGNPRTRRQDRGGLQAQRRRAHRGGAAFPRHAPRRRGADPRRPAARGGEEQPRDSRRQNPGRPLARSQGRGLDARGRAHHLNRNE